MTGKKILIVGLTIFLFGGFGLERASAQTSGSGQALQVDPERSALMLRKGQEFFSRAKFNEAKDFFRKAVQADPTSQKAWSYYDLSLFYTVGEQYKNHGRIVLSSAPPTGSGPGAGVTQGPGGRRVDADRKDAQRESRSPNQEGKALSGPGGKKTGRQR